MSLSTDLVVSDSIHQTRTHRIWIEEDKIEGFADKLEALKQTIYCILSTEQYEYPIYSFGYGVHFSDLIGAERLYVRAEMKRMIQEALLRDERILDVEKFEFDFNEDQCTCTFLVQSIYGDMEFRKEVPV